MKRTLLISMAAYASASLRGEGVEEVGEQMEHFPTEGYDGMGADRRLLLERGEDGMVEMEATRQMEDYFGDETEMEMEIIDEYPDADFIGEEVEDFDPEWEDPDYEGKEYLRDESLEAVSLFVDVSLAIYTLEPFAHTPPLFPTTRSSSTPTSLVKN